VAAAAATNPRENCHTIVVIGLYLSIQLIGIGFIL
jgi:hypothetical protein